MKKILLLITTCLLLFTISCKNKNEVIDKTSYRIKIIDENKLIYDKPFIKTLEVGKTITLHAYPINDMDLVMYVNGKKECIQTAKLTSIGYIWEFNFTMIKDNVELEFKLERSDATMTKKKPLLIAHRGGKGYGVENTKEAFLSAIELGYDGVECDIQPDKNHFLVVCHDLTLTRLAGENIEIKNSEYENIKDLILTKTENGITHTGKILSFDEFLTIFENNDLKLFIELKESCTMDDLLKAISMINNHGISKNRIMFISNSNKINLLYDLKKTEYSYYESMFVGRTNYQQYLEECYNAGVGFDCDESVYDVEGINHYLKFKENSLPTGVWVVNNKKALAKYINLDVDYITTDVIYEYE